MRGTDVKSFNVPREIEASPRNQLYPADFKADYSWVCNVKGVPMRVKLNPFNSKHFNLNHLVLNVDGEQFPTKPEHMISPTKTTWIVMIHY